MDYDEFAERWAQGSKEERKMYDSFPVSKLVEDIAERKFGGYYQIWYSLRERAELEDVGWLLFDILRSGENYLTRFHCASALIAIAGLHLQGFRPEQLSARRKFPVDKLLHEVADILEKRLGQRAES